MLTVVAFWRLVAFRKMLQQEETLELATPAGKASERTAPVTSTPVAERKAPQAGTGVLENVGETLGDALLLGVTLGEVLLLDATLGEVLLLGVTLGVVLLLGVTLGETEMVVEVDGDALGEGETLGVTEAVRVTVCEKEGCAGPTKMALALATVPVQLVSRKQVRVAF